MKKLLFFTSVIAYSTINLAFWSEKNIFTDIKVKKQVEEIHGLTHEKFQENSQSEPFLQELMRSLKEAPHQNIVTEFPYDGRRAHLIQVLLQKNPGDPLLTELNQKMNTKRNEEEEAILKSTSGSCLGHGHPQALENARAEWEQRRIFNETGVHVIVPKNEAFIDDLR